MKVGPFMNNQKKLEDEELIELKNLKLSIEQKEMQVQNLHLQLENSRLRYKILLLTLKDKYKMSNDSSIELETGNIISNSEENKVENEG